MLSQKEYHDWLVQCRLYHRKFEDMKQSLFGKTIIDNLANDIKMLFSFGFMCAQFPYFSYRDHVELRVMVKEMDSLDLPSPEQWKTVQKYGRSRYKLHE